MTNIKAQVMAASWIVLLIHTTGLLASGGNAAPLDPNYVQECGSCHVAYPPRLLSASSWSATMNGLSSHFGVDASLEPPALASISSYLAGNAKQKETRSTGGQPILRITETRWFLHEHDEITESTWKLPAVRSRSNCSACHTTAEQGVYSEHKIRIPQ